MSVNTDRPDAREQGTATSGHTDGAYEVLRIVDHYDKAQETVDLLSDKGFPVERVRIIGRDIISREQITGRMTLGKAAGLGAATGAWLGLFFGLIMALFAIAVGWFAMIISTVLIGAVFGAIAGLVGHALTRGRRDFRSVKVYEAAHYEVQVQYPWIEDASVLVAQGR